MKVRIGILIPVLTVLFIVALAAWGISRCRSTKKNQPGLSREQGQNLVGCWKEFQIREGKQTLTAIRKLALKPNGKLYNAMVYELGPRSRLWTQGDEIDYRDGEVRWNYFKGKVNQAKNRVQLEYDFKGNKTAFLFIRADEEAAFMQELEEAVGTHYTYKVPTALDDSWPTANISTVGMDEKIISSLIKRITRGKYDDLHGLLVVKNGKLVLEEYFASRGKRFGPPIAKAFRPRVHHLGSTTKAVTSALIGLSMDKGYIKSVDDPIFDYLPAYAHLSTPVKKRVKIKHLLTMSAGLQWEQFKYPLHHERNDAGRMWRLGGDVIQFYLEKPVVAEPGSRFCYSNGVSTVLGAIIEQACGMAADTFAQTHLFAPLGITDYSWTRYPDGSLETDGGLALKPRDLSKIGQLFLNGGTWQGKPVISKGWIEESTRQHLDLGRWGYGYKWMQKEVKVKGQRFHYYFIPGYGGQILALFPGLDMVVVITAANYESDPKTVYYKLIRDYILPAVHMPPG